MIAGCGWKVCCAIAVHDHSAERMRLLHRAYGATEEPDLAKGVRTAHLIVLAVRPNAAEDMLRELVSRWSKVAIVSCAKSCQRHCGTSLSWLRNRIRAAWMGQGDAEPAAAIGNETNALTFGRGHPQETL